MTLIRRRAASNRADVLRGDRSPFDGEVIESCESARRINMGEDWTDIRCQLTDGHAGEHRSDDYRWDE